MSASIDALAMAGADYEKLSIDPDDDDGRIPRYLLAENFEASMSDNEGRDGAYFHCRVINDDEEATRKKSMAWTKQMSASIDALAMAGADYEKLSIDPDDDDDRIPRYLLAENFEASMSMNNEGRDGAHFHCRIINGDEEATRKNLMAWAKQVGAWIAEEFPAELYK
ncbi:uncharacterized protein A4U43_C03F2430 [Asparagus officinalis]|uniref:Ig-like domain-containing protein n=1 Tax=Asparagus officinalis TaxID=4686 RepID=A0A5P1F6Q7_ASPOF|nr:uncharacterized protein A4U43_C03F2430 [Asparagus officinalis]